MLLVPQFLVSISAIKKFLVCSFLNDTTFVQDEDFVGIFDSTHAVGYQDDRNTLIAQPANGILYVLLRNGVQRRGSLVQYQYLWLSV